MEKLWEREREIEKQWERERGASSLSGRETFIFHVENIVHFPLVSPAGAARCVALRRCVCGGNYSSSQLCAPVCVYADWRSCGVFIFYEQIRIHLYATSFLPLATSQSLLKHC